MDENFNPELTLNDICQNESRNLVYRESNMEEELIIKFYTKRSDPAGFKTASDLVIQLSCINPHLNMYNMGRALKALDYERVKSSQNRVYGYLIKPLFATTPLELLSK